ncbi:MFS domain-containing histidine kinase [Sporosarcina sp. YIM B06819]|uniref:sensor histidine kinase n=1 Tax=Sporosarcina sp. YIM B06819 TaxID=3081769 RepID=UPI00298D147C|nr:MFS domain-containing histidine kinase [Sporosarcina sp. YIM B06819]
MKNNHSLKIIVWTSLVAVFLMSLLSFIQESPRHIGKNYVDISDFKWEMWRFYENIGVAVLNPPDIEAEKRRITVTRSEIEEHRNYYGTLSEQIGNIEEQYVEQIADAEAAKSEKLKLKLVAERDAKIEDIRKNFESDAYVEAKVRASKEKQLEEQLQQYIQNAKERLSFPVSYELTDIETGEIFKSGNVDAAAYYKKTFNAKEGYLRAESNWDSNYNIHDYPPESYEISASIFKNRVATEVKQEEIAVEHNQRETVTASENKTDAALEPSQPQAVKNFEGTVVVPKDVLMESSLGSDIAQYNKEKLAVYILWGLGVLSLVALLTVIRFNKEWVTMSRFTARYHELKLDLKVALLILSCGVVLIFVSSIPYQYIRLVVQYHISDGVLLVGMFGILLGFLWAMVFQLVLLVENAKIKGKLEQEIKDSYSAKFVLVWQGMFLNRKIGTQMLILLIGFFLAGIGLFGVALYPPLILFYAPLALFVGLPFIYIFVSRTAYLNQIMESTKAMAEGRLHKEIVIEGKSPLAEHAKNLNNLREGVRNSMSEQAKSERLKTELITNVSHDLRTPLTSIITYTDLLKNEDLTAEERTKYVDVLDKKSQRLKTLIEDLFEVSKMASGNLELQRQRVDLTQLLQQALAEHEEEISKTGLDFRVSMPDSALVAYVDGKRWWRVLDNLIVNAIKYTLPGTRVYITLRKVEDRAEFVVKNVTKYELGENTDELFERFKRADTSRHTDGSGLGLAIAQSIVDLHNGNMTIEVDGDLFKVTVTVAA